MNATDAIVYAIPIPGETTPVTVAEIQAETGRSESTVRATLKRMIRRGLVMKYPGPTRAGAFFLDPNFRPDPVHVSRLWSGFSETISAKYPRVVINGKVYHFVGFRWVDEGEATKRTLCLYPTVIFDD